MEDDKLLEIPLIVYEMSETRHEKKEKKLIYVILFLIVCITACNMAWLYVWNQYDYETDVITIEQDGEGLNNFNRDGTQGDITFSNR